MVNSATLWIFAAEYGKNHIYNSGLYSYFQRPDVIEVFKGARYGSYLNFQRIILSGGGSR